MSKAKKLAGEPAGESLFQKSDPETWVATHGNDLFRYATARLRDVPAAEDAVQETFLAALKSRAQFRGEATEKNWLLGILKNKIADHFRELACEPNSSGLDEMAEPQADNASWRDGEGRMHRAGPREWSAPELSLNRQEFWETLHACSARLPRNIGRIYAMREFQEVSSDEICAQLKISPANLWVMLHRARAGLRRCLEVHWFGKEKK